MGKHLFGIVVTLAMAGTLVGAQMAPSTDEAAIRELLTAFAKAREGGDGAAQAAFFTEDADEWRSSTKK